MKEVLDRFGINTAEKTKNKAFDWNPRLRGSIHTKGRMVIMTFS